MLQLKTMDNPSDIADEVINLQNLRQPNRERLSRMVLRNSTIQRDVTSRQRSERFWPPTASRPR
jgi:hypothetical protein